MPLFHPVGSFSSDLGVSRDNITVVIMVSMPTARSALLSTTFLFYLLLSVDDVPRE